MVNFFSYARLLLSIVSSLAVLASAQIAVADQQVTLESGTVLVGQLSMDGRDLIVNIEGAELRVSLRDVAEVTAVGANSNKQSQRFLLKSLETGLLLGDEKRGLGLLAEAHRLSPDDSRIAFWYARSLVAEGNGKAANNVFNPSRKAIEKAYPGNAQHLVNQIQKRLALESLPEKLLQRIDQFSTSGPANSRLLIDNDFYAAYFQVIDQNSKPIRYQRFPCGMQCPE